MSKVITITNSGFIDQTPLRARKLMMKMIYSMARQFHWDIRVEGQKW